MIRSEIKGVKEIRPKIFLRRGKIKIYVRTTLWSDSLVADMVLNVQNP